jgi:hypothetical protein|nr:MAG TPA_asm: hypothetical protein [Bacteriophage sp.]
MNATVGSCRLNFSRLRRGKSPLEEQEVDAAKNEVCCNQHILLFAKMQIRFARKGHLFVPNFSGCKTALRRAIFECRNYLKNRHEYPATFHAAKLCLINNTLYISKYRQSQTEATTPRKYSSSMKKKAFICPRI